jgi:uncharacterized protein (TIGR02246 family)
MSTSTEAVTALLAKYNEALNASSTDAVMPLYAEDGVLMPPYSQSVVGSAAVRKAYDAVFKAMTLRVKFSIAEIVELGPGWAFARTNSAGTTTDHATGAKSAEGNQELFIFKKDPNGDWKIARYSLFTDQFTSALAERVCFYLRVHRNCEERSSLDRKPNTIGRFQAWQHRTNPRSGMWLT